MEGAGCIDAATSTIFFGGTQGIDCFNADSLDEQLRNAPHQLWLDETSQILTLKQDEPASWSWILWMMGIGIVGGIAAITIYHKRRKKALVSAVSPREEPSQFVIQATAIAKEHLADANFTAEQMAQEMAMSRSKLFMLMKQETGKAVMEFVRDLRLDYAAEQLKAGMPVSEIADRCGFSDPSSFRRSFVRKFRINPSQYRYSAPPLDSAKNPQNHIQ